MFWESPYLSFLQAYPDPSIILADIAKIIISQPMIKVNSAICRLEIKNEAGEGEEKVCPGFISCKLFSTVPLYNDLLYMSI